MNEEHFPDFLKKSAVEIDLALEDFFADWNNEVTQTAPQLAPFVHEFQSANNYGKRIRGTLVLLGYSLFAADAPKDLLKIAVAYELFQTAILVHDDIIDNSPKRRGKPSLHMALGGEHFGMSQAMCLGDMGFFLSYKLIAQSSFDDALKSKALVFYSSSITDTVLGEMLDVSLAKTPSEADEDSIETVSRLKTAYYTFVAPLSLGAILAGADDAALVHLKTYGENTGIAFQITDDLHDVFGTEASLKKEAGGDMKEGKQTLLILKAQEKADKAQQRILSSYGNQTIDKKKIEAIKQVFEQTGAKEYSEILAQKHAQKARNVIPDITKNKAMQRILETLLTFVLK